MFGTYLPLEQKSFDGGGHLGPHVLEDAEDLVLHVLHRVLHEGSDGLAAGVRHQAPFLLLQLACEQCSVIAVVLSAEIYHPHIKNTCI